MKSKLEKLRDYFAGEGDEATRREIRRELDTPGGDLRSFMEQVAETSSDWLPRVCEPWAVLNVNWHELKARTALGMATLLGLALCRQARVFCSGVKMRGMADQQQPSDQDIAEMLEGAGAVPFHGQGRYVWLGVEGDAIQLKVGESAARTFASFQVEFRRGADELVASVSAHEGVAVLAADMIQGAMDRGTNAVVIVVKDRDAD